MKQHVIMVDSLTERLAEAVSAISFDRLFCLTDTNTLQLCWPLISDVPVMKGSVMITIGATDNNKTIESLMHVWESLQKGGATRHSLLVNLGGGMITDLGGFAASTFKRGIKYINIPTTLLSQVDASVGGKTGINFGGLKNEIGVFNLSESVLLAPDFLRTLDDYNLLSGYAEMLKHGLLDSKEHLTELLAFDPTTVRGGDVALGQQLVRMVECSVAVKQRIVEGDPMEFGVRKALNFGHTAGHAIESLAMEDNRTVLHGYAVAWGLVMELYMSAVKCGFPSQVFHQVEAYVREYYGKFHYECRHYDRLIEFIRHDKKNVGKVINFTLLGGIGDIRINQACNMVEIEQMLDYYRES